jgi:predicted ATP-dependent serine protease
VREGLAAFGEIGLTGRLRPAAQSDRRLDECRKLGIVVVAAPEGTDGRVKEPRVLGSETLRAALGMALERAPRPQTEPGSGEPHVPVEAAVGVTVDVAA